MKPFILLLASATLAASANIREYRFTVKYEFGDVTAKISREETAVANLSLNTQNMDVLFKDASLATGSEPPQKLPFLAGVQFNAAHGEKTFSPDFFKSFPAQAFEARNMVWDTLMFLNFARVQFTSVNQTVNADHSDTMDLAGSGTFTNKNVQLTWSGYGERNGTRCLLIDYRAFQNPLTMKAGATDMHGRSDYWGQMWISTTTHEIEYGTIFEDVIIQTVMPGQSAPAIFDVFRSAVFEPGPAQ